MELNTLIRPVKRWWWLILIATLLAGGASYLATRDQPLLYESRATLMIGQIIEEPNPTNTQLVLSQQLATAYADMAGREPVRRATMEALGISELPNYNVRALPNTQFLELLVVDTDPVRSQAVANELANQLVQMSPGGQQEEEQARQEFIDGQLDDLQAQIEATQAEIDAKLGELGDLFSAQQIANAQTEIQGLQGKLGALQSNYAALLASTNQDAVNVLSIIEPAGLPQNPSSSDANITILAAAGVGLILAVGVAFVLDYLDDTIKNPEYVTDSLQLETLAYVPTVKGKGVNAYKIVAEQPRSPISESFRGLRTNMGHHAPGNKAAGLQDVEHQGGEGSVRTILVTSTSPKDGKSMISANLATVLAMGGKRVLLIDADLHHPRQDKIFELKRDKGLMSMLSSKDLFSQNGHATSGPDFASYTQDVGDDRYLLAVLTSGPLPEMPAEELGSEQMQRLIKEAAECYDYVVIDSPPVLAVTDAAVLSAFVDSVLLVINSKRTRRVELQQTVKQLQGVEAPLVGVVLNRYDSKSDGYGYRYYYGSDDRKA